MATKTQKLRAAFAKKNSFANRMENAVRIDLHKGITSFRNAVSTEHIERAVNRGQIDNLFETLPWRTLESGVKPAQLTLFDAGAQSAAQEAKLLPFSKELRPIVENPAFKGYLENHTGELVTLVQNDTLQNIRNTTKMAFTHGYAPADVAANIKDGLGLNDPQQRALNNYRNMLQKAGTLSDDGIASAVSGYGERLLNQRAIMIARTEVRFAANAADKAVWDAAESKGFLPAKTQRIWVVDGAPCPKICLPMNGIGVGLREKWRLPDGRMVDLPTEAHPNCMCIAQLDIGDVQPGRSRR